MNGGPTIWYVGADEAFAARLDERLADVLSWSGSTVSVRPAELDGAADTEGVVCILVEDDPPTVDGVELTRRVRADGLDVPVVLVGDHTDAGRVEAVAGDGPVEYAPKTTAALDLLVERVREVVDESAAADWYRAIVEYSSTDVLVVDEEGRWKYVTPSVAERTGYTMDELEGSDSLDTVHPEDQEALAATLEDVADGPTGASATVQYRVEHADGSWHTYESTLTNRLDDPLVEGIVINAREIAERQRLEDELEDVFERVDDAFYAVDEELRFTYVNDRAEELLQADSAELIGESVWEMYPEATETPAWDAFHEAMETQEPTSYEVYFDPLEFWVEANVYPSESGLSVYFRDVTERKEREQELEQYQALTQAATDIIVTIDEFGTIQSINPAVEDLLGYDPDSLVGAPLAEIVPPDLTERHERGLRRYLETGERSLDWDSIELPAQHRDGHEVPMAISFSEVEYAGDRYFTGILRDVTEQKERLRQQRVVADLGQRGLESNDLDGLMAEAATLVSETLGTDYCKVLDLDPDAAELLLRQGVGWEEGIVGSATVSAVEDDSQAAYTLARETPVVVEDLETETRFSGPELLTSHDVRSGISTIIGPVDDPWGILGTHGTERRTFSDHDVNFVQSVATILATAIDRVERERDLRQYETIVETVGDGVYVLDENSRFTMVNDAYIEISGYTREELLGTHSSEITGEGMFEAATGVQERLRAGEEDSAVLETELPTADGGRVPVEAIVTLFPFGDGEYGRVGVVRDISARRRFERTLTSLHDATQGFLRDKTREAVAERIVETASEVLDLEGSGVYLADDDSVLRAVAYSDYVEHLFGDLSEYEFGPDDTSLTRTAFDRGETITFDDVRETDLVYEEGTPVRSGIWIPLAGHGSMAVLSEEVGAFDDDDLQFAELLAATAEASLDRVEREQAQERRRAQLARLNEFSQALTGAETVEAACESAVEAARETLDLPISAIEEYDETTGELRPIAQTPVVGDVGAESLFTADSNPVWRAYVDSEGVVYDDLLEEADLSPEETELRSAIILPLGEHGVFISGATEPHAFTEDDVSLATILAANTRAALDRVAREQTLRKRTAELEETTETLQRLNRINGLVRNLTQGLIQATTREGVDDSVCAQLVRADPYQFVWICDRAPGGEEISIRAMAGDDGGYLDAISPSDDDVPPSSRALRMGEVCVENTINATPPLSPWRREALSAGVQSVAAVPIRYRDSTYGVLVVHATEAGVFTDLEQTVLRELGEMVGYAINALEQRQALVSQGIVELEFSITDPALAPLRFTRETDAHFELETFLSQNDGSLKVFFTVSDVDPETVTAFVEGADALGDVNLITEREGGYFFETTTSSRGFLGRMLEYGAHVTELTAESGEGRVVVELPVSSDVRTFIEMFLSNYEGAELLARRELERSIQTDEQFESVYRDRLTERQEEVLRTAYASGYFEWPREVTGEGVAEALGVSQPTVNRHIRTSQQKLFDLVFGDE